MAYQLFQVVDGVDDVAIVTSNYLKIKIVPNGTFQNIPKMVQMQIIIWLINF